MSRLAYSCVLLLVASVGISSCRCNPRFCEGALDNNCDNLTDALQRCTSNEQCEEPTAVCDVTDSMTCVQCTLDQADACSGTTPACGEDRLCRACRAHSECRGSDACLPDGSCANTGQVAHVKPASLGGTDNANCTLAMPCTKVASALATGRSYVKFTGTIDEAVTVQNARVVTFLAETDAKLTRTSGVGPIVTVRDNGTSLTVYDLSINTAPNDPSGIGVVVPTAAGSPTVTLIRSKVMNNPGGGISVSGGTLTVSQSAISANAGGGISSSGGSLTVSQSTLSGNTGGGISVTNGRFVVVGNVFFGNGTLTGTVGGISISTTQNPANRLEFNTFNKNASTDGFVPAIQCMVGGVFTARNNIISGNLAPTNMDQVGGNCMYTYSIVRPGTLPPGGGNSNTDPLFVNTTTGDLHVRAGSPVLGAADPNSNLTGPAERDIDGDVRTAPADIGADEIP